MDIIESTDLAEIKDQPDSSNDALGWVLPTIVFFLAVVVLLVILDDNFQWNLFNDLFDRQTMAP